MLPICSHYTASVPCRMRLEAPVQREMDEEDAPEYLSENEGEVVADLSGKEGLEEEQEDLDDDATAVLELHQDAVYAVAWSPCDGRLAFGGGDDVAHLTSAPIPGDVVVLKRHEDSISSLSFAWDGTCIASGGLDGVVLLWDVGTGQFLHKLEGPTEGIEWVDWHPRGKVVLAGAEDGSAWMWDAKKGTLMMGFHGHASSVTCGRFTPDGLHVVTGSSDASLKVWDPKTGTCLLTLHRNPFHDEAINTLDVSQDSTVVLSGSADGSARLANIQTGRLLGRLEGHAGSVESVGFCRNLGFCATAGLDNKLNVWDLNTLTLRSCADHPAGIIKALWHPHEPVIYTACVDGIVRLWDARTVECVRVFRGHTDAILDMAMSPDGEWILTGSDDCTVRIFHRSTEGMEA